MLIIINDRIMIVYTIKMIRWVLVRVLIPYLILSLDPVANQPEAN